MATTKKRSKKTTARAARVERPYPRETLEEAVKIPLAIRQKNGGNAWPPAEVANAVGMGATTNSFFYLTAASRDYGLTEGTRDTAEVTLTDLGRRLAFAETPEDERATRREAFMSVAIFREVLEYYKGSNLPEMKYLGNTLEGKFKLDPRTHEEFATLFRKNCEYLAITEGLDAVEVRKESLAAQSRVTGGVASDFVTVAEPEGDSKLLCFVAMPFGERKTDRPDGFFSEVLKQIIAPAGRNAGFRVVTARKRGSDVIHATIVNGLIDADMVVVDLTEHNPNVLFELGVRLAHDKPVALIRATGTAPIFDVDHMLRVEEYSPCLWPSTVETDLPKIQEHIAGAWANKSSQQSYMKILRDKGKSGTIQPKPGT
ncbi:MAG: hypothetical protein ABI627_26790 [Polyangiaceae bacterium]